MKRKRVDNADIDELVHKINKMEPSRKRKLNNVCTERNTKRRYAGTFKYSEQEYKNMIFSLYKQNKRLLERLKFAESKYDHLVNEIKLKGLQIRATTESIKNIPEVVI